MEATEDAASRRSSATSGSVLTSPSPPSKRGSGPGLGRRSTRPA